MKVNPTCLVKTYFCFQTNIKDFPCHFVVTFIFLCNFDSITHIDIKFYIDRVTENILATSRPSTELLKTHKIIEQFKQ